MLLACCMGMRGQDSFRFGTNTNPDGVKFEVGSRGFIVGGRHMLPVMGEIHYARVPEKEWKREIQKMKAGGITIVATYVFWIHHEEEEGRWDWSGNRNLRKFLEICREEQMPVVLRIGPFCHGEVYQGGFPVWLTDKASADPKQYKLRSQAPGFMEATRNLYSNIFAQVKGLLWKDGGPIVGVQIENECRGPWSYYMALKDLAVEAGFDTPFYTRTGWPKLNGNEEFGKLLPLYGDYADGFWDRDLKDMPGDYPKAFIMKDTRLSAVIATEALGKNQDTEMSTHDLAYPYLTCELGGGMMTSYHRRINMSGREVKPLAICKLGSGSNLPGYYMYHGGTNPIGKLSSFQESKITGYPNDYTVLNYDFQAPLSQYGEARAKYGLLNILHLFIEDFGERLAPMECVQAEKFVAADNFKDLRYAMRTDGTSGFVFVNSYQRLYETSDITDVELVVGGKDSGISAEVAFPKFDVKAGSAFFLPFNMDMDGVCLECATVQPICHDDNTWYFMAIDGIAPMYRFAGQDEIVATPGLEAGFDYKGLNIVTLTLAEAMYMRRLSDKIYMGHGKNLYEDENGQIRAIEEGIDAKLSMEACNKPFEPSFIEELKLNGKDNLSWKKLSVDSPEGFVEINEKYDCGQIYADGKLVADNFYMGLPWRIPARLLYRKECYLVTSEYVNEVYF